MPSVVMASDAIKPTTEIAIIMTNYNISSQRDEIDMLQKDVDQLKVRLLVMSSQLSGIERLMTEKKSDKMTVWPDPSAKPTHHA
jgi:hypothetical protein